MIRATASLAALDAEDERAVVHRRTYHEALDVMLALWEEARTLNPHLGNDWQDDLAADIAMARTLNAVLPPNADP